MGYAQARRHERKRCTMILLLTAGIMGITLFVLAKAAKHFGLPIKGKALALAGVLACAIACALPFVAPFLTEGYYLKLGALAVAAALLVTGYNAYLWKEDAKAAESADETAEGESKDARTAEETLAARTRAAIGPQRFKWEPPDEPEEEPAEPEPEPAPKPEPVQKTESEPKPEPEPEQKTEPEEVPKKAPDEVKEAKPEKPPEKKEEPIKKAEQKPIEKISEPPQKEAPVLQAEPPSQRGEGRLRQGESPVQQDKKQDVSSAGATTKTEPAKPQAPIEKPEPKPIEKPEPEPKAPAPDFSTFTTLDDYLDYADAAQKKGDLERATTAYANAVDIYVSDPYIIYLYMDLGNLLKQQARYTDCINVYHAALSIPILAENPAIAHEFEKNIRYLEIVQAVLKRHHAEGTPFGDIPDAVRAEIEAADQALEKKSASKDETS